MNGHILTITADPEFPDDPNEFDITLTCPDSGKNCESWIECDEPHRCEQPECVDDPECDDWVYEDGMNHGVYHQYIESVLCVEQPGRCWMQDRAIEFDRWPQTGRYTFDDVSEFGSLHLCVVALYPIVDGAK